jgi:hypothetical protein
VVVSADQGTRSVATALPQVWSTPLRSIVPRISSSVLGLDIAPQTSSTTEAADRIGLLFVQPRIPP